jgi:hypothetical protein
MKRREESQAELLLYRQLLDEVIFALGLLL